MLEFNNFVDKLRNSGVNVVVFSDTTDPETPDSIFPNNWVSFHSNSTVCLYPMYAENRRQERRKDLLDSLVDKYSFLIESRKDFTYFESEDRFLRIEADLGKSRAVQDKYRDDESFAGVINNKKDVKKLSEDSVGKIVYHAPDNGLYKVVVNAKGELALEFLAKEKG